MYETCTSHPSNLRDVSLGKVPISNPRRRHVNPISLSSCVVTIKVYDIYELISTSPPALAFLPAAFLSKMAFLSASSFKLVMTTLEGWIPIWTVAPLDLSVVTRSTWMTHFFR
jgi:hypothetical protein